MRKAFVQLDLLQVVVIVSLTALLAYLLLKSVQNKCNDCGGYYTKCLQQEAFDGKYSTLSRTARKRLRSRIWSAAFRQTNADSEEEQLRSTSGRKYDWIGLDQTSVLVLFWISSFTGALATLARNRLITITCIVLSLFHLIVLVLVEVSDDRDFPSNLFRQGRTVALYSILYLDNTTVSLVLKAVLLALFVIELLLQLIYFVLLRFERLLHHQLPVDALKKQELALDLEQKSNETQTQTSLDGLQEKQKSSLKSSETQTEILKEAANTIEA